MEELTPETVNNTAQETELAADLARRLEKVAALKAHVGETLAACLHEANGIRELCDLIPHTRSGAPLQKWIIGNGLDREAMKQAMRIRDEALTAYNCRRLGLLVTAVRANENGGRAQPKTRSWMYFFKEAHAALCALIPHGIPEEDKPLMDEHFRRLEDARKALYAAPRRPAAPEAHLPELDFEGASVDLASL